jgi:hypothetical protein
MKEIVNKTARPVRIPLPGGKFLHLGPAKSGQVSDQATHLPSFQRLLSEGTIEFLSGGGRTVGTSEGPSQQPTSTHGHPPQNVVHPKGDR